MEFTYNQYIDDILTGKIKACRALKNAVKRHVKDLDKAEGTFPYYFDNEKAQQAIQFAALMVHTKGKLAGQTLKPEPWQQFFIAVIYGWRRKDNGKRRFTRVYLQVARKNGKSFIAAFVGLYDLITERGAEVYSAATKKDQAKIVFEDAHKTVSYSPILSKRIHAGARSITCGDGKFLPLSKDSQTQDGLNPSCGIIDEYHAHKDDSLLNVIESGMGAREQPLLFIITTAGYNINGPCHEEYERCIKMLEGQKGYENDQYAAFIWELDKKDNKDNPENWIKANPNLEVSVSMESLLRACKNAKQKPDSMAEFLTKRLNIWINNAESWIDLPHWKRCQKRFSEKLLIGQRCWGAFDLSKRRDFTVLTFYFYIEGKKYAKHFFYIPQEQIEVKMKTDHYMIETWVKEGRIKATPGDTVDYDFMFKDAIEFAKEHEVIEIAYDRNLSEKIIAPFAEYFTMVEFGQNIVAMSEPSKDWEKAVCDGEIVDNDPVAAWMVSCASIKRDENDNIKVVKPDANKTSKRIDCVITSIMANNRVDVAISDENKNGQFDVEEAVF